jgi:thiol-disulfide isomerase/thioredoxin
MNIWQKLKKTPFMAAWFCAVTSSLFAAPFSNLSFEAASKQAAQTGKIVLVDFYTTWCGPCKSLDKGQTQRSGARAVSAKLHPKSKVRCV